MVNRRLGFMRAAVVWGALGAALVAGSAAAQVRWYKSASNPVLVHADSFPEGAAIGQPAVLAVGGELRMWYTGGGLDIRGRILAARSADGGLTWQRDNDGEPVLDTGPDGAWDSLTIDTPEVVADTDGYKLYYYGSSSSDGSGASIGLATSSDGLTFTRWGTAPVLQPGPPGSWDERWVESPAVIWLPEQGRYLMWYSGMDAAWRARVGLATSTDGVVWVKYAGNPVLDVGPSGSWEDYWVAVPGVIRWGEGFLMVYSGVSEADLADGVADDVGVGIAFSADGVTWRRLAANPVMTTQSPPHDQAVDHGGPWAPDLVRGPSGGRLLMLYESSAGICLAVSPLARARRARGRLLPAPAGGAGLRRQEGER
jgi:predicted GH43/DUF377 family glycosyl hydrolase